MKRLHVPAKQRERARAIAGKTIRRVHLQPFDPNEDYEGYVIDRLVCDPVIEFTDGTFLQFVVQETEVSEYGVDLVYPAKGPEKVKR